MKTRKVCDDPGCHGGVAHTKCLEPQHTPTPEQVDTKVRMLNTAIAAIAQGVINIDVGIEKVEKGSRIYLGMKTLVNASEDIVRAVNAHEELLEAAKACLKYGVVGDEYKAALRNLIAKAEGKDA